MSNTNMFRPMPTPWSLVEDEIAAMPEPTDDRVLLDGRDLTDAERRAVDDVERPGVWRHRNPMPPRFPSRHYVERRVERHGEHDEHELTQHETDVLIATELWLIADVRRSCGCDELQRIVGNPTYVAITVAVQSDTSSMARGEQRLASEQRGGIHSDPLVRLLAYRTWGERDRAWGVLRRAQRFHDWRMSIARVEDLRRPTMINCHRVWDLIRADSRDDTVLARVCIAAQRFECSECGRAVSTIDSCRYVWRSLDDVTTTMCPECYESMHALVEEPQHASGDDVGVSRWPL